MSNHERILLKLCFPQFANPSKSRFESLFFVLTKKKIKNTISYIILPELIIQGIDKRTTLILKNIPNYIKKYKIRNLIQKYGNINFLCIIPDSNFSHLVSVYLNVINYKTVVPIYMGLRNHHFNCNNNVYIVKIFYSDIQGKEQLKKIFKINFQSSNSRENK